MAAPVREFITEEGHGQSIAYSPFGGNLIACGTGANFGLSGAGYIYIVDCTPDAPLKEVVRIDLRDNAYDVCWSEAEPNMLVSGCGDGFIHVWNIGQKFPRVPVTELKGNGKLEISSVDWNLPKFSNHILASSWSGLTTIYDPNTPPWPILKITTADPGTKTYQSVWSPHRPNTFLTATSDGKLRLWDTSVSTTAPTGVFQSAAGSEVLTCDWCKYSDVLAVSAGGDSIIYGWDLRNPAVPYFELQDHGEPVKKVKFSPFEATQIASASYDRTVRIHDYQLSEVAVQIFDHHSEYVQDVDWNLHRKGEIVSCSWDKTIKIVTTV